MQKGIWLKSLLFFFILSVVSIAQSIGMPPKVLAVLTQKVQAYIQDFPSNKVTIIYKSNQSAVKDKLITEFRALGYSADAVTENNCASVSGDILILLQGLSLELLQNMPVAKKIVLSANKRDTDEGYASFSIVNQNGKPKIMVNLEHIAKSGIKVSGKLYRIAQKAGS